MTFNYYKHKFIINISLILVFFIAVIIFIIYPAMSQISQVNKEITTERLKLEKKLALGLNIKKIAQDLQNIEKPAQQLDTIFLAKGQELDFINNLESLGTKYSVSVVVNSDFVSEDLGSNIYQVNVQVALSGNYLQVLKFLHEVENQKGYFTLKSISLFKNRKSPTEDTSAQLIGNIYFKK